MMVRACAVASLAFALFSSSFAQAKEKIHALYIPLADHCASAILPHAKYLSQMKNVDYEIEQMASWPALRGKFMAGEADVAFVISPMAMAMFRENPNFQVVSLVHRDGNALAVNDVLAKKMNLSEDRKARKPDDGLANALKAWKKEKGKPVPSAVPHLEATHVVVLYKYLKEHGLALALALGKGEGDVTATAVPPPKSPEFLKTQAAAERFCE